ncbi:hypothetical protein C343_02250 [Cryptococcus neoformans C23]|uniref:Uncharacterized protein n=1 Tax=Cryptococcus neoformans Tu259-1 TaxID=1230072 RepID=A0A854QMK5_CRYNE|nr:hypothetical protein C347_02319 [Cryptococcus neoformans var. grubii AD2-60a]OWZ45780.1 hypothetical protein C343_02250 [Cryptococcus neoformans var. grubii C23]OXC85620.1 hypothetical protein C344_02052 [Cryptococcus neoformans var. grubii AD1-7a]OXG24451.1 hypothetical protein C361_02305 [Cryptococcus neoformans var. grubii Tu259-1]OXG37212.1 hypothetical protein C360_02341 [Cryptococcus neoformans var. grubii Bt15]OXG43637.1 hypothetical protein C359_01473 [Cryptococcus neoformans var. g
MRSPAHSQGHIFGQPIPAFPLTRLENKGETKSSLVPYGYFERQRMPGREDEAQGRTASKAKGSKEEGIGINGRKPFERMGGYGGWVGMEDGWRRLLLRRVRRGPTGKEKELG